MTVRVLLADDQQLVRAGFRLILAAEPDIAVVAEASDGIEAVNAARRVRPDVILMDIRMPRLDGIAATSELTADKTLTTRVVVLTTFDVDSYVYDALRAGGCAGLDLSRAGRDSEPVASSSSPRRPRSSSVRSGSLPPARRCSIRRSLAGSSRRSPALGPRPIPHPSSRP